MAATRGKEGGRVGDILQTSFQLFPPADEGEGKGWRRNGRRESLHSSSHANAFARPKSEESEKCGTERANERASEGRISSVDLYANIFATVIFAHFATRQAVRRPLPRAKHRAAGRTDSWTRCDSTSQSRPSLDCTCLISIRCYVHGRRLQARLTAFFFLDTLKN